MTFFLYLNVNRKVFEIQEIFFETREIFDVNLDVFFNIRREFRRDKSRLYG